MFRVSSSCRCAVWSLQNVSPYIRYSVDIVFFLLREYWVLTECRIPLKPVVGGGVCGALEWLQFPFVLMNRLNEPCLLFSIFLGSLFLKGIFSQIVVNVLYRIRLYKS